MSDKETKEMSQWLQWTGLGVEFAGTLGVFTYGGYKADEYLATEPWCLVGGFLFALTGLLYLTVKRAINQEVPKQKKG